MHSLINYDATAERIRSSRRAESTLERALAARERFLGEHPHLRPFQAEIDDVLEKSGNHQGRLAVLGMLIQGKLLQLQLELVKLNRLVQNKG